MIGEKAILTLISGCILSAYGMMPDERSDLERALQLSLYDNYRKSGAYELDEAVARSLAEQAPQASVDSREFQWQLDQAIAQSLVSPVSEDDEFNLRLAKALSLSEMVKASEVGSSSERDEAQGLTKVPSGPEAAVAQPSEGGAVVLLPQDEALLKAIKEGRSVQEVRILIAKGGNPNVRCAGALTPLMWAAQLNKPIICALLIGSQAEINAEDDLGNTPLDYAAQANNLKLCRLLVSRGAELNPASQKTEITLLGRALARQVPFEIYRYLSRSGAKL